MKDPIIKILLLDDEKPFRESLRRLLRTLGTIPKSRCCAEAENGSQAIKELQSKEIDIALIDYRLPGENGVKIVKRMLEIQADLVVVMLTGESDTNIAVNAMKNGASDFLVKGNLKPSSLLRAVQNAYNKAMMQKQLKQQQMMIMNSERNKVMLESVGAACHHIGQPATVLNTCFEMLKECKLDSQAKSLLENCEGAVEDILETLKKMQRLEHYQTEQYTTNTQGRRILKVER